MTRGPDITLQLHPAADKALGVINNVRCNYQNILRVKYFTDVRYLPGPASVGAEDEGDLLR